MNIDTNLNEVNNPTPPKEEVKEEKKETNVVEEIKTKDLKSENLDEDRRSFFSPIKFVRFPSMFGDEKVEKRSLFKDENVIKVNFEYFFLTKHFLVLLKSALFFFVQATTEV